MAKTPQMEAMLHAKCPRCRRGEMFKTSMYGFESQKMYDNCPKCNLRFEIEPGYFYAAMYVGYAFNVALAVTVSIITYWITKEQESPWIYVIIIFLFSFALAPVNFRYSRVILLYWLSPNIKYVNNFDHD